YKLCLLHHSHSIPTRRSSDLTYGGGVNYINTTTGEITNYRNDPRHSNSISNDIVPVVLEDSEGNVWMGTEDAGLNLLEKENIGRDRKSTRLNSSHVKISYAVF